MTPIPIGAEPAAVGTLPVEPSFSLDGNVTYRRKSMKTQGGDYITKSVATDPDEEFSFRWVNLKESDFIILRDFFTSHSGPLDSFIWNLERWHYKEESLEIDLISVGQSAGKIYNVAAVLQKIPEICPASHPTST